MSLTLSYSTITNVTISDAEVLMLTVCHKYNEKVQAIKYIRTNTGLGLKEAKDMVDQFWNIQNGAGIAQHWSTPYYDKQTFLNKESRCYNCYPQERTETLGDLLRNKLNEQR